METPLKCTQCPDLEPFPTHLAYALHSERHRREGDAAPLPAPPAGDLEPGEVRREPGPPRPSDFSAQGPARTYQCPEDNKLFETPETLSTHMERHREVMAPVLNPDGSFKSTPCPKGCGRHFVKLRNSECRAHVPMCDGSAPLGPRVDPQEEEKRPYRSRRSGKAASGKEEPAPRDVQVKERKGSMAMKCDICGQPCANGTGLSAHRRNKHKSAGAPAQSALWKSRAKKASPAADGGAVAAALEDLKVKRAALISESPQVGRIDKEMVELQQRKAELITEIPGMVSLEAAIKALESLVPAIPT
jgi:hypothetical protein